jgi:MarR family transcriptional regulator, organic hydroperoxide resistance regulator
MDEPKLGPILEFMRLLWALDHALNSRSKRMNTQLGVTGPQRLVVRIVGKQPGISAKEIAHILHVDKSTLSGVLQRLETRGLLDRSVHPGDARRARFALTVKGRDLDATRAPTIEASVRRALGRATERQLAGTRQLLELLVDELQD